MDIWTNLDHEINKKITYSYSCLMWYVLSWPETGNDYGNNSKNRRNWIRIFWLKCASRHLTNNDRYRTPRGAEWPINSRYGDVVPRMTLLLIFFTTIPAHKRQDYANTWEPTGNLYSFIIHLLFIKPLSCWIICEYSARMLTQFPTLKIMILMKNRYLQY